MTNPTWPQVARRPKWIFGLFLAIAIAAVFALLGQWQLERTFTEVEPEDKSQLPLVLIDSEKPGAPLTATAANKRVKADLMLDTQNVFIVSNRLQLLADKAVSGYDLFSSGYWVIANSRVLLQDGESTASLSVGIGFAESLSVAEAARAELMESIQAQAFLEQTGRYLQTEGPVALTDLGKPYLLESFSLAQLVNLYKGAGAQSLAGFMVLDSEPGFGLETIVIAPPEAGTQVNWLTLFYALEWALFAGFAVFLWWRLVEDARIRELQG
jgi:surfeit locus 1 family protein